jgi:hypothetical protein
VRVDDGSICIWVYVMLPRGLWAWGLCVVSFLFIVARLHIFMMVTHQSEIRNRIPLPNWSRDDHGCGEVSH